MTRHRLLVLTAPKAMCAWNPEADGASKLVAEQIEKTMRSESFTTDTRVWWPSGLQLKNRTVPAFKPRPGVAVRVKVQ